MRHAGKLEARLLQMSGAEGSLGLVDAYFQEHVLVYHHRKYLIDVHEYDELIGLDFKLGGLGELIDKLAENNFFVSCLHFPPQTQIKFKKKRFVSF